VDDFPLVSEMVNQELTNRKVMEEAQKLESNYGIENMIVEISNILRDSAKKCTPQKRQKKKLGKLKVLPANSISK
jgi:HD superfamily phosphohydrolase YqeK